MQYKGIYINEKTGNAYYVNSFSKESVNVSMVIVNPSGGFKMVLEDTKKIPVSIFKNFYHSGNYTKQDINN